MPPEAMASSVVRTTTSSFPPGHADASACSGAPSFRLCLAAPRIASSSHDGWGNLGARPKPPCSASKAAATAARPASTTAWSSTSLRGSCRARWERLERSTTASRSWSACSSSAGRWSVHAWATARQTSTKAGRPCTRCFGK